MSYHDTRGYSEDGASQDAAIAERDSGKTSKIMEAILEEVALTKSVGLTSAELRRLHPMDHHGRLTSGLTKLHIAGKICALTERRGNCGVYVTPEHVQGRETRPYRRQGDVAAMERAFRAGWEASGEGWNGEFPDEGVKWEESAGYKEYHRWMRGER